ncbi:MAG: hypothetical protein ACU84J_15950 [Gammaproteobacteria bacterium]
MTERLELITGKPAYGKEERIATFTRFTLPFAFLLTSCDEDTNPDGLYYESVNKNELDFIKRKKYFTRETADTLYERGQWLAMCSCWEQTAWGREQVRVSLRNRNFNIGMLPPRIVLFELPEIKTRFESSILQTGFLYVDIYFGVDQEQSPELDDLLVLNEFFRYFGISYDTHANIFQNIFADVPIKPDAEETIASMDALSCYFERWAALLEIPLKSGDRYYRFFPEDWANDARKWMYNTVTDKAAEHWQIYADNRCYVWAVAFLEQGGETLKSNFEPEKTTLHAKDYGHWIRLLNVDYPPFNSVTKTYLSERDTHLSVSDFERDWADIRTYKRWEHSGTWYGYCYHSAAILAPPKSMIFGPACSYYFDTSLLLFYIRMTLYRFGRELSKTIPEIDRPFDEATRKKLRELRGLFSRFTILYRFPMLSNQQQSMEMYEINRQYFEIDQFFSEIQQEVDNTHEFLELLESQNLAHAANRLAKFGIPLAAGGLLTALFSMSDFNMWECFQQKAVCTANPDLWFQFTVVITLLIAIPLGIWFWNKRKK